LLLGLDLGQITDYAALSLVSRSIAGTYADGSPVRSPLGRLIRRHDVLAIKRYEKGTSYIQICRDVREKTVRWRGIRLVLDATGVGRPIVDIFRELLIPVHAITITGGKNWSNPAPYEYNVSKFELVAAARIALEMRTFGIAADAADEVTLAIFMKELLGFKVHNSKKDNELYDAREGENDDMVLCATLPIWYSYMMDSFRTFLAGPGESVPFHPRPPLGAAGMALYGLMGQRGISGPEPPGGIVGGDRMPPS
jgi:hypothetical protein